MKYQFFTIPSDDPEPAMAELNRFLASHRVIAIDKRFIADGLTARWLFCISWQAGQESPKSARSSKVDYREILDADDFGVYARLRELRKNLAERHGVPAYAIFTNEQLAEMARRRCGSREALRQIDGIGDSRIDKYADDFLAVLAQAQAQDK